jgi:hypothetical protein
LVFCPLQISIFEFAIVRSYFHFVLLILFCRYLYSTWLLY